MNEKRDFDRAVEGWLDDGTDATPPEVIDAVLLAARSTPQEWDLRSSWRTSLMKRLAYAAAAVAALVVGAAALSALDPRFGTGPAPTATIPQSPSPSASAQPSSPLLDATFTSAIHAIAIDYPSGWQTRPATEPWTGDELSFDSPAADVIYDPKLAGGLYLLVASQPYGDLSEDEWRDDSVQQFCPNGYGFGSLSFLGLHGWVVECGDREAAFLLAETRGYLVRRIVPSDPTLANTYDWDWFRSVLKTVNLRPADAR